MSANSGAWSRIQEGMVKISLAHAIKHPSGILSKNAPVWSCCQKLTSLKIHSLILTWLYPWVDFTTDLELLEGGGREGIQAPILGMPLLAKTIPTATVTIEI